MVRAMLLQGSLFALACVSAAAQTWTLGPGAAPGVASTRGAAFSPLHGGVVMHGGFRPWCLRTGSWQPLSTAPITFATGSCFFDAPRARLISIWTYGRVFTFTGSVWQQQASGAPWPRSTDGMVLGYDETRGRVVQHGGSRTDPTLGRVFDPDTWEYDGANWSSRTLTPHPGPDLAGAMAYDTARQRMVFAGSLAGTFETWEYDGNSWTLRTTATAPAVDPISACFDAARNRVVMLGTRLQRCEVWEFDGTDWQAAPANFAPLRTGTGIVFDRLRARTVLYGGTSLSGSVLQDTWEYDGLTWTAVPSPQMPVPRTQLGLAYDLHRRVAVLFGGYSSPGPLDDTLWEHDGVAWSRRAVSGARPSPRRSHVMAYDARRGRVVVYGGSSSTGTLLSEVWEFDAATNAWLQRAGGPSPRFDAAMVFDRHRGSMVLFGGNRGFQATDETWTYDGTTWMPRPPGPPARSRHAMAYDAGRCVTVLFGGVTPNYLSDTWEWDGAQWRSVNTPAQPTFAAAMDYDIARGRTVLYGGTIDRGSGPEPSTETWEYDGTTWQLAATLATPLSLIEHEIVYDHAARQLFLFGGSAIGLQNGEQWHLEWPATPSFTRYGTGCPGIAGVPALAAAPASLPRPGQSLQLDLAGLPAGGVSILCLGFSQTSWNGVALPSALGGRPDCLVWTSVESWVAAVNAPPAVAFSISIPNRASLAGLAFSAQAVVLDALGGFALSNGGFGVVNP
jgi:hypothetical protein